ncbi:mechanosensitive ion channel family protein [Roseivirga sp. BDSF3-8]|uniref:mechanosensitive ion channel family protein n=1 Tax=Roseivirga sp. BDSF3-8 TaxID=3241598 RepID=UPI0035318E7D
MITLLPRATSGVLTRALIVFMTLIVPLQALAFRQSGDEENKPEARLQTPYHTIKTHLDNLQEDAYHPEVAAEVFIQADSVNRTEKEAIALAVKLKHILDGSGTYIDTETIPKSPDYRDTLSNQNRYYLTDKFPDIYLQRYDNLWLFSEFTARRIDKIHEEVYPFGTAALLSLLPRLGHKRIMGLHLWQHIGILILVLLSFIIHKLLTLFFERVIVGLMHRFGYKRIASKYILPVAKPLSFLVIFLLLRLFIPLLLLPPIAGQYVILVLGAALPLFGTLVFYHLVDVFGAYLEKVADRTESTLDDQLVPLVRKALKAFVIIIGGLFILQNLNFDVTALIAGISIGGLAFALAAQETIKNFFGSLMIFVDKPFQIGDWITSGGEIDGTVEEVGFRSTRIRTFRNSVTSVPNGKLADMTIDNHGLRVYRRFYTRLNITYDTPPEVLQAFIDGLKKVVIDHPDTRKDFFEIHFNELGATSLEIMFYIFFAVPTWSEELICRHQILMEIVKLAETLGVRFAFPTQTLHIENLPGQKSLTPEYTETGEQLRTRLEEYLKARESQVGRDQ